MGRRSKVRRFFFGAQAGEGVGKGKPVHWRGTFLLFPTQVISYGFPTQPLFSPPLFSLPFPLTNVLTLSSPHAVTIRLQPIGAAPQLRQRVFRVSASNRFETVVLYLRRKLGAEGSAGGGGAQSVFCYVNNTFAPGLDEGVGGLWRVSFFFFSFSFSFSFGFWRFLDLCLGVGEEDLI